MVEMMSEILAEAALISAMAVIAFDTTSCPCSAESFEPAASWLACLALSAVCRTVAVISSRLADVSSRLAACSCAPEAIDSAAAASC